MKNALQKQRTAETENLSLLLKHRMIERQKDFTRKDLVVKLEGKEAKAYLNRVAGLLIKMAERLEEHGYVVDYLIELSVCLKFFADMSLVKRMEWNGKRLESSRFMRIGIDTRTGFPLWDDIETEIEYYRKIMEKGGNVEKFKEELLKNPEQKPDYYKLYQDMFAEKILTLGLPPMPEQKKYEIEKGSPFKIVGHDLLNFFVADELTIDDCNEFHLFGKPTEQPKIKQIFENIVHNDAEFLKSQIKEINGNEHVEATAITVFLNNEFTKNQLIDMPDLKEGVFARISSTEEKTEYIGVEG